MDGSRFDELTRMLAGSVSRRTALKAALAGLIGRVDPLRASAAQSICPVLEDCTPDRSYQCVVLETVDGSCLCAPRPRAKSANCQGPDWPTCATDTDCGEGYYCAVGWCPDDIGRCYAGCEQLGGVGKCLEGMTICSGKCVDLSSDIFHCGSCTTQCMGVAGPGYKGVGICVDGECQLVCREDADHCGDECTDFEIDSHHCGGCGQACPSGSQCCGGRCVAETDSERFCDFCGYLGGWPQGCLAGEVCDRGVCITGETSESVQTGRVEFQILSCPGEATAFLVEGPLYTVKYPATCRSITGETFILTDSAGVSRTITTPESIQLPLGVYRVQHPASGTEQTFQMVPTESFWSVCGGNQYCLQWWSVVLFTDTSSAGSTSPQGASNSLSSGSGSLEVHLVDCPPGYRGTDFYNTCHGNGIAHMEALLTNANSHQEATTVIEQSPGPGIARFSNLAPGTYELDIRTKFVKAPAYVYCSPDQGVTVLVDEFLGDFNGPVQVPIYDQAVVCDWHMLN